MQMLDDSPELLSTVASPSDLGHEVADRLLRITNNFLERYSDDALKEISLWIVATSYVFDGTFCDSFLSQLLEELKNLNKDMQILPLF
jgi:hypothetical protein